MAFLALLSKQKQNIRVSRNNRIVNGQGVRVHLMHPCHLTDEKTKVLFCFKIEEVVAMKTKDLGQNIHTITTFNFYIFYHHIIYFSFNYQSETITAKFK